MWQHALPGWLAAKTATHLACRLKSNSTPGMMLPLLGACDAFRRLLCMACAQLVLQRLWTLNGHGRRLVCCLRIGSSACSKCCKIHDPRSSGTSLQLLAPNLEHSLFFHPCYDLQGIAWQSIRAGPVRVGPVTHARHVQRYTLSRSRPACSRCRLQVSSVTAYKRLTPSRLATTVPL